MWIWTYSCHIKAACCPVDIAHPESEILNAPEDNLEIDANLTHLMIHTKCDNSTRVLVALRDEFGFSGPNYSLGLWHSSSMTVPLADKASDGIRIITGSTGETAPIATDCTPACCTRSRHVEFQFIKPQ